MTREVLVSLKWYQVSEGFIDFWKCYAICALVTVPVAIMLFYFWDFIEFVRLYG